MSIDSERKPISPDIYVLLVSTAYIGALLKEIRYGYGMGRV